ncbi:hypothetical protein MtrunA17_Chr3g0111671 [Medicago truncatula]|uniref:Transmembrane protein, putative n=1 Tax=Medicago truncatula TaxID=3880 RepID=A0A072UYP7_MEDTR|nr:transmembrane protein, putative [Medicago truncatula]RHN68237.1 hypothetical protein MtrunA17_Chr3g0111671 [Medicago truncatula]
MGDDYKERKCLMWEIIPNSIANAMLGNKEQNSKSEFEGAAILFLPKGFWLWHLTFWLLLFLCSSSLSYCPFKLNWGCFLQ